MLRAIVGLVAFAVLYFVGHHEYARYRHCAADCTSDWDADVRLLRSDICSDPEMRLLFQGAGTVDCDKAERRTRFSPAVCASERWRRDSNLMAVWSTLTSSYLALVGVIVPVAMVAAYGYTSRTPAVHAPVPPLLSLPPVPPPAPPWRQMYALPAPRTRKRKKKGKKNKKKRGGHHHGYEYAPLCIRGGSDAPILD